MTSATPAGNLFTEPQYLEIAAVLRQALTQAGNEAADNLREKHQAMEGVARSMGEQQEQIKGHMEKFHEDKEAMKAEMVAKDLEFKNMKENLANMAQQKDAIIGELAAKHDQVEGLIGQLKEAMSSTMTILRQTQGGLEDSVNARFGHVERQMTTAEQYLRDLSAQIVRVEGMVGSSGYGRGGDAGGSHDDRGAQLISVKDMKLPILGDGNPSVMAFRKWYRDLSTYCEKRRGWRGAETLFRVVRGYPNQLAPREFPDFMSTCTARDRGPEKTNVEFTNWMIYDKNRELYECVEYALNGKCGDVVANILSGDGFELFRKQCKTI